VRDDRLVDLPLNLIDLVGSIDVEPIRIKYTCSNNRARVGCVSKWLDRFAAHNLLLWNVGRYRSWVGPTRYSNHILVVLEFDSLDSKIGTPFKINLGWATEE